MSVFKFYLFIYLFRKGKGGRKRERNINVVVASHTPTTGDLARNPGMCPDWESNLLVLRLALSPLSHTSQGSILLNMYFLLFRRVFEKIF